MSLARQLWGEHGDTAATALAHPFVRGIADGSLPQPLFRAYVAQDAFFLDCYARAYALALARSPDTATVLAFAGLIAGVRDELTQHATYALPWGVDPVGVAPGKATRAYTDFLLATAATGPLGLVCAAMAPCMRLYAHLGQTLAREGATLGNPYEQWISTYAGDEFEALAQQLETLLDDHSTDAAAERVAYARAMDLEMAFFDAAITHTLPRS